MNNLYLCYLCCRDINRMKILPNILKAVGNSPLVRLNNIPKAEGIKCEMCKYFVLILAIKELISSMLWPVEF